MRAYVHADGYVLDRTRGGGEVTSEGQAYALLRAAWMGDLATFERVLRWTDERLRRPDGLVSWRWAPGGAGRLLDVNSATDADADLAFALIVAAARFERPSYLVRAREAVRAIRMASSIGVPAGWFPSAGNWATTSRVVNLSYFTPYAYPYFEAIDPDGGWREVTTIGYGLLDAAVRAPRRLPPDFMAIDLDGQIAQPTDPGLSRTFSFDAVRTYWRVELDCRLHGGDRACQHPSADGVTEILRREGRLATEYDVTGRRLTNGESLTFDACMLPMLERRAPDLAAMLRRTRLATEAVRPLLHRTDRYYDLNWIWFGLALADGVVLDHTPRVDDIRGMAESMPALESRTSPGVTR